MLKITNCLVIILLMFASNAHALRLQCYSSQVKVINSDGSSYYVDTSACEWVYEASDMSDYPDGYPYNPYTGTSSTTSTTPTEILCGGNPVMLASGKKFQHESDFSIPNDLLAIERFYYQTQTHKGVFGAKWLSNFDYSLKINRDDAGMPVTATLIRPNGQQKFLYRDTNNNQWFETTDKFALFARSSTGVWTYKSDDGTSENYDDSGRITMRSTKPGQTLHYRYFDGKLVQVVSQSGRVLTLAYNSIGLISQITTPDQQVYRYEYSESRLLSKVTSPDQTKRSYFYEDARHPDALTAISINDKNYAKWRYDEFGRAILSQHAKGAERTLFEYNDDDSTTVTNPLGKKTTYHFTTLNGKKLPTTIEGHESGVCYAANKTHSYDTLGFKDKVTDWQGNITDYDYNDRGFITKTTTGYGTAQANTVRTEWHKFLPLPISLTTSTLVTSFAYDDNHRLVKKQRQSLDSDDTRTWTYQYQLHDNGKIKHKIIDGPLTGNTDSATYSYDDKGNLLGKVNALGHKMTYGDYNELGLAGFKINSNGLKTIFKYDTNGRLHKQIVKMDEKRVTKYRYNAFNQLTKVIGPDGNSTIYGYDRAYRKTTTTNALGQSIQQTLDAAGNTTEQTFEADEAAWQFNDCTNDSIRPDCVLGQKKITETIESFSKQQTFDALSRVINISKSGQQSQHFARDANGNVLAVSDGEGNTTSYEYDHLNRKVAVIDSQGNKTTLIYNDQNKVIRITDARGNSTTYTYNAFGEKTHQNNPDSGEKTYLYNQAGQLISTTDANGNNLIFTYDLLGRILTKSANADMIQSFEYDECNNGIGQICRATDNTSIEYFSYHDDGSLHKKTVTFTNALPGNAFQLKYQYDINGRIRNIHYPSGLKIKYKRDAIGNVINVKVNGDRLINQIRYKPFGKIKGWTFANGQQRAIQYDDQYRVSRILASGVQDLNYQRNLTGSITALSNLRYAQANDFDYDGLNRLTTIGGSDEQNYNFDSLGNRTAETTTTATYTIADNSNRLTTITSANDNRTFSYDGNGNITTDTGNHHAREFGYNANNRMESVKAHGETTRYSYNTKGQRIEKRLANGDVIHYIYTKEGKLAVEITNDLITKEYIYLNGSLIALSQNDQRYYVFTDHQGRPEIVTDATATTVWQAKNKAFDRTVLIEDIQLNIGFPGQYWDEEKQSWYNGFRDYDATLGRYLQSDPIGIRGGINTYLYGNANTLMFTDESGLLPEGGDGPIPPSTSTGPCVINITTDPNHPKYLTANGTIIELNKGAPDTVLPTGATLTALILLADASGLVTLLVTGGAETISHSSNSFHYQGLAVDIAGPLFNNLTQAEMLEAVSDSGFTHIVFENKVNNFSDHWHLQIGAGNGLDSQYSVDNSSIIEVTEP